VALAVADRAVVSLAASAPSHAKMAAAAPHASAHRDAPQNEPVRSRRGPRGTVPRPTVGAIPTEPLSVRVLPKTVSKFWKTTAPPARSLA
jgi:hypothetical protein